MTTITNDSRAMPEWLKPRKDKPNDAASWVVESDAGYPVAHTNIPDHFMRVPYGSDDYSRVVRAHELMHAQISPYDKTSCLLFDGLDPRVVEMSEECRVNTMIGRAGFPVEEMRDGAERLAGQRLAERNDWPGLALTAVSIYGTGGYKPFVEGVRSVNPEYAKAINAITAAIKKKIDKIPNEQLADTTPSKTYEGVPRGFTRYTRAIAEILQAGINANSQPLDGDGQPMDPDKPFDSKDTKAALKGGKGGWAKLVLDTSIPLSRRVSGSLGRKRIATNMGRNPRRIQNMLTDPHRRVFDRHIKGTGGIVVIDQSGSMHLTDADVWSILEAAPGCVVIGYSHSPGSKETPNVWVIAERGKVAERVRDGNGGNGVDGPALRFAASKRRNNEAFVWVCDGLVTDSTDEQHDSLTEECASLVIQHRIHQVPDAASAIEALRRVASGKRLETRAIGGVSYAKAWKDRDRADA